MTTITKKQASLALIVVALAAVMIAGTIASSADNSVFAKKHKHGKHASVNQGISLSNTQDQHSSVVNLQAQAHQLLHHVIMQRLALKPTTQVMHWHQCNNHLNHNNNHTKNTKQTTPIKNHSE